MRQALPLRSADTGDAQKELRVIYKRSGKESGVDSHTKDYVVDIAGDSLMYYSNIFPCRQLLAVVIRKIHQAPECFPQFKCGNGEEPVE